MTDLSVRNRIIVAVSYIIASAVIVNQKSYPFAAVFFLCVGLIIFFADKIFDSEKVKEKTLCAFFVAVASFNTLYQFFFSVHENTKQLMSSFAAAVFLAAAFALTDKAKMPYALIAAPLLCFLDLRIALGYSLLLCVTAATKFFFEAEPSKKKKGSKKKKKKQRRKPGESAPLDPKIVLLAGAVTGFVCFAVCIYLSLKAEKTTFEQIKFFLTYLKNTFGFVPAAIFLLVKIFKSNCCSAVKIAVPVSVALSLASAFFFLRIHGWTSFSFFLLIACLYLALICLDDEDTVQSIRETCCNNKFLAGTLLLLCIR